MKLKEAEKDPNVEVIHTRKLVTVIATDKHYAMREGGSKRRERRVPAHMVKHLVKNGMIEDPNKKKVTPKPEK